MGVSIPFSSGSLFRVHGRCRHHHRRRQVSIPFSSGSLFRGMYQGFGETGCKVSIPFSSGSLFRETGSWHIGLKDIGFNPLLIGESLSRPWKDWHIKAWQRVSIPFSSGSLFRVRMRATLISQKNKFQSPSHRGVSFESKT